MKKSIITLLFIFVTLSECTGYEFFTPFNKEDLIKQSIFIGMTSIDWMQTKSFRSEGRKENLPLLGPEPTQGS